MNEIKKIGIIFNATQDAALLLKGVRRFHPDAHIVAIAPARAPLAEAVADLANAVLPVELSPLRLFFGGAAFNVVGTLREQRFDLLIVRFGTLKLRLLSALAEPALCEIWQQNGTIFPAPTGIGPAVRDYFKIRLVGMKTLVRAWCSAHLSPVRSQRRRN